MVTADQSLNYYEVLEIKPEAQQHEITTAYERARYTYSTDNPAIYTIFSANEAREFLSLVEEAYAVLGNKTLRNLYDEKLFSGQSVKNDISYSNLLKQSKQPAPEFKRRSFKHEYKIDADKEKKYAAITDWNGPLLKEVREYKSYSFDQLCDVTKITSFYINALEQMQSENLPAPVFVRGYVQQLARIFGLNEKIVADSYMKNLTHKLAKAK